MNNRDFISHSFSPEPAKFSFLVRRRYWTLQRSPHKRAGKCQLTVVFACRFPPPYSLHLQMEILASQVYNRRSSPHFQLLTVGFQSPITVQWPPNSHNFLGLGSSGGELTGLEQRLLETVQLSAVTVGVPGVGRAEALGISSYSCLFCCRSAVNN